MTAQAITDVWEALATARAIRRFTDTPVDDATLHRCLEAATWAPSGGNAQHWRFIVLDSPEMRAVVQQAADEALKIIEPIYGMTRPADDDRSRNARRNRATYELHDLAGTRTSVLFVARHNEFASDFLQGASIFPAVQNFYLAARAQGLGACPTSWAAYGGEPLMRAALGIPAEWVLAGHIVVGCREGTSVPRDGDRSTTSCSATAGRPTGPTSSTAPEPDPRPRRKRIIDERITTVSASSGRRSSVSP